MLTLATDGDHDTPHLEVGPQLRELRPSRRCAVSAMRWRRSSRSSASRRFRICCSCCRCATKTARASCRSARCSVGERAVVEGEVQLTEVAFRGRRQLLCRIGDGSGSLTLRFFHFSVGAAAGTRARRAHALLRRDSPRPDRPRDRASRISARRRAMQQRGRGSADADLSADRRHSAGSPASAHDTGAARSSRIEPVQRLAAADRSRAICDLPSLREALEYVHRPPPDASLRVAGERPTSGAAPARVRRAARASAEPATAAARRFSAIRAGRSDRQARPAVERFLQSLPFKLDRRTAARVARDRARSRAAQSDAAPGARRCRLRQDRRRRARGGARRRSRISGGGHGADRTARRAARAQFRRLARAARSASRARSPASAPARRARARSRISRRARRRSRSARMRLFQEGVEFKRLGLAIVDEQHRFGVHQRLLLREKGAASRVAIRISSS